MGNCKCHLQADDRIDQDATTTVNARSPLQVTLPLRSNGWRSAEKRMHRLSDVSTLLASFWSNLTVIQGESVLGNCCGNVTSQEADDRLKRAAIEKSQGRHTSGFWAKVRRQSRGLGARSLQVARTDRDRRQDTIAAPFSRPPDSRGSSSRKARSGTGRVAPRRWCIGVFRRQRTCSRRSSAQSKRRGPRPDACAADASPQRKCHEARRFSRFLRR
jgi:hypothetical protein